MLHNAQEIFSVRTYLLSDSYFLGELMFVWWDEKSEPITCSLQVYVAEADGIWEYGTTTALANRLVAVKFLLQNASEKEK